MFDLNWIQERRIARLKEREQLLLKIDLKRGKTPSIAKLSKTFGLSPEEVVETIKETINE